MESSASALGKGEVSKSIGRSIAQLHKERFGKGPETVRSYVHDDCVLVLMYKGHTRQEETLDEGGEEKAVAEQRVRSSEVIQDQLVGVVESEIGRKVIGYMTGSQQDPSLLSHVFVLEPTDLPDVGSRDQDP